MSSIRRIAHRARELASSRLKLLAFFKKDPDARQVAKASWKHLFAFASRDHFTTVLLAVIATVVAGGLRTFLAVVYGRIFDVIATFGAGNTSEADALHGISTWCLILTGMGVGTWISNGMFMSMWIVFGEAQARSVRREVFSSLLEKDMAWYDGQVEGTSSLLTRIETQTRELQLATSQPFGLLLCDFLVAVGSVALALYSSWELTLILLASLPISFVIMSLVSRPLEPAIQAQKRCLAEGSKLATASLTGIDLVKIFNGFDSEMWQYFTAMKRVTGRYLVQARCNALQMGYVEFWLVALFAVGFWYGAVLVDRGANPGDILTTFYATFTAFQGVDALMPQFLVLSKGMAAGLSLRELAPKDGRGASDDAQALYRPGKCLGDVDLTDVSFAYPSNPTKLVLEKSSFSFAAGDLTFLVGKSGSGKSTISNLILSFYDTLTGEVRIDGHRLNNLDPGWVRENITLVQQSSVLFDDTFYRNVAFGLRDPDEATEEEVKQACEAALLQSTIASLPDGMDTMVGSGGYSLSGGQKQRLALARARLRDPPILILDEVTSGLDHVTRTLVMEAIREWRKEKTTIIITHDVAQIEDTDYVYVMDKGKIVQEGYRGHLIGDEDALFASLVKSATDDTATSENKNGYEDDLIVSPVAERIEETPPVRKRVSSVFESLGEGLFPSQSGAPKGISFGGQFALATRMRESHLWEVDERGDDAGAYGQVRPGLLDHILETSIKAGGETSRPYSVLSQSHDPSPRNSGESSFDLVEHMGKSIQASRLEDSEFRQHRRRSGATSILTQAEKGEAPKTTPGSDQTDPYDENTSIARILRTVVPNLPTSHRVIFFLGIASCFVAAAAIPVFSYLLARLFAALAVPEERMAAAQKWAIILLGAAVADGLANFLGRYLMEYAGQSWISTLRVEALKRILRQPKAWFDTSGNSVRAITECLDRNAEEMRNLVGRFLPGVLIVVGMILAALVWALIVSWKLTLVSLSPAPLVIACIQASAYFTGKWEARCNERSEAASAVARQSFINVRVVRALTLEGYFSRKYDGRVVEVFALGVRRAVYAGVFYGLQQALNVFITALVFYYAIKMMTTQELGVDAILQVVNLLCLSIGTSTAILGTIPQIAAARATAVQMLNYANLPASPPRETEGGRKVITPFPIVFNGLSFAYPSRPSQQVLRNVNLQIDTGTSTAIVGPSGCGKSTLASLLLGLYAPSFRALTSSSRTLTPAHVNRASGEKRATGGFAPSVLSFGGIPWDEADVPHLRSTMSYVPQAPFLFPASIAANIAYGIPERHPLRQASNIEAAARAAGIHSFVETLAEGYATLVGDGGLTISGGQAQRICIARAMARWPRVLVMDEPTSALDAGSAESVREAIRGLVGGGTGVMGGRMSVVVVTHCREMMRVLGRVVVLEGGFVVEEGGFEELMGKKGRFAKLVSDDP